MNLTIITADGVDEVIASFNEKQARLMDDTPAMKSIGLLMERSTQLNFEAQGRPTPWAPLAASTLRRRRGKSGHQILRDTGYLWRSVTSEDGGEFGIRVIGNHEATIGTNRPGASVHQNGGVRTVARKVYGKLGPGRKRGVRRARPFTVEDHELVTPQRKFMLHQPQDIEDYKQTYQDWLFGRGPFAGAR